MAFIPGPLTSPGPEAVMVTSVNGDTVTVTSPPKELLSPVVTVCATGAPKRGSGDGVASGPFAEPVGLGVGPAMAGALGTGVPTATRVCVACGVEDCADTTPQVTPAAQSSTALPPAIHGAMRRRRGVASSWSSGVVMAVLPVARCREFRARAVYREEFSPF